MKTKPKPKKTRKEVVEPLPQEAVVGGTLFPTHYLRFVKRASAGVGFVGAGDHKILQQLWAPLGWRGHEAQLLTNWRPEGEWRDVEVEEESK